MATHIYLKERWKIWNKWIDLEVNKRESELPGKNEEKEVICQELQMTSFSTVFGKDL